MKNQKQLIKIIPSSCLLLYILQPLVTKMQYEKVSKKAVAARDCFGALLLEVRSGMLDV